MYWASTDSLNKKFFMRRHTVEVFADHVLFDGRKYPQGFFNLKSTDDDKYKIYASSEGGSKKRLLTGYIPNQDRDAANVYRHMLRYALRTIWRADGRPHGEAACSASQRGDRAPLRASPQVAGLLCVRRRPSLCGVRHGSRWSQA